MSNPTSSLEGISKDFVTKPLVTQGGIVRIHSVPNHSIKWIVYLRAAEMCLTLYIYLLRKISPKNTKTFWGTVIFGPNILLDPIFNQTFFWTEYIFVPKVLRPKIMLVKYLKQISTQARESQMNTLNNIEEK